MLTVPMIYSCPRCFTAFAKWGACRKHVDECVGVLECIDELQQICREAQEFPRPIVPDVLEVVINNISGMILQIDLRSNTTVMELKCMIQKRLNIPVTAQNILINSDSEAPAHWRLPPMWTLRNSEQLGWYSPQGRTKLELTLVRASPLVGMWSQSTFNKSHFTEDEQASVEDYSVLIIRELEGRMRIEFKKKRFSPIYLRGELTYDGTGWISEMERCHEVWEKGALIEHTRGPDYTVRLEQHDGKIWLQLQTVTQCDTILLTWTISQNYYEYVTE